jgi:hypothetical protein
MTTASAASSAQSLRAMGLGGIKTLQDQIFDICVMAQRGGALDCSLREIQKRYELRYSKRIDVSSISGRVHNLVLANRLERLEQARECSVTGRQILPVRVPLTQARLVA